jgi:cold shock CspA family protein
MAWEYCTQHRWEKVGEYEVDLEQKDLLVVTDRGGVQHSLLRGKALERQKQRIPLPKEPELKVETVPVAPAPTLPLESIDEPEGEAPMDILDALESETEAEPEPVEEWQPNPEDWYTTTVIRNDADENFIFTVLDNNERVFIHEREIRPLGSHYCFTALPFGSEVQVRMERSKAKGRAAYTALEARIETQKPSGSEISIVANWTGTFGSLRRPCGCFIFGKTKSPDYFFALQAGDRVSHEVTLSDRPGKGFIAINVRPHSGEEFKQ